MTTFEKNITDARIALNSAANRRAAREVERHPTIQMKAIERDVLAAICAKDGVR